MAILTVNVKLEAKGDMEFVTVIVKLFGITIKKKRKAFIKALVHNM